MQEQRHDPSDRSGYPLIRDEKLLKRSDHKPLHEDAVKHCYAASDDPSHSQRGALQVHVNTLVYGQVMSDRLTKSDWIEHGLRTLANGGANALKVGPMATKLKVSRGSFYWHFRDIADFRSQVLRSWQERMTDRVIRDLEAAKAEPDRLKHLMRRAFVTKRSLDRAIRS